MQRFMKDVSPELVSEPCIGVASVEFSPVDAVYIDSNGYLAIATTSSKVLGFCMENKTTAASNATTEKYKPQFVMAFPFIQVALPSDQDCTQTDIGAYADLSSATTGAQTLNLVAGATGQFFVMGFDPENISDDDDVVVCVAEPQWAAFAQS